MSGPTELDRRAVLKLVGAGLGATCLPITALAQQTEETRRPKTGDLLVKAGDASRTPLKPADVPERAAPILVWAMDPSTRTVRSGSRLNQIILLRLPPEKLAPQTKERAADGVVAYTAICTHSGCETVDWINASQSLSCSCHDSLFDPADDAMVLSGPAPRNLPALPLTLADGQLVVAAPFTAEISFEAP